MTFGEYLQEWALEYELNQRPGQWAFNLLERVNPGLANTIRGSAIDPFHQDDKLAVFFDYVNAHWGES